MFLIVPSADRVQAQIRLPNGRLAGEGFGRTKKSAMYLACLDAIHNGFPNIALAHANQLSIADENSVRATTHPMENPMTDNERRKRHSAIIRYIKTKYPDTYVVPGVGWAGPGWQAAAKDERTMMRQAGIGLDPSLNPLNLSSNEKIGIGVGLLAGLAALTYYVMKPAIPAKGTPTIQLQAGTPGSTTSQSVTLTQAGLIVTLPTGGVWGAGATNGSGVSVAGTSNPITIPWPGASAVGQSATLPIPWTLNGAAVTTNLMITVAAAGAVAGPSKLSLRREVVRNLGTGTIGACFISCANNSHCATGSRFNDSVECPTYTVCHFDIK